MRTARLTIDAKQDIAGIRDHYKRIKDPDAARRIIAVVRETYRRLVDQPYLGESCEEFAPNLRCGIAGSWLVYYRPTSDGIEIVRVLSASREVRPYMFRNSPE